MIQPLRLAARQTHLWGRVCAAFAQTKLPPRTYRFVLELQKRGPVAVVMSSHRTYAQKLLDHHLLSVDVGAAYHDTERHKPNPSRSSWAPPDSASSRATASTSAMTS